MAIFSKWFLYFTNKAAYAVSHATKKTRMGEVGSKSEMDRMVWSNFVNGKLTYLHQHTGDEMVPTIGGLREILLVRKLPSSHPRNTFVGDVVVFEDPQNSDDHLVRRLAAAEGDEMVSTDEKEDSFILEEDQCWVLSDNQTKKVKEAKDSRTFGPISMESIVGRVIYRLRGATDHGPIENSENSMYIDNSVLQVELDVNEMEKESNEA